MTDDERKWSIVMTGLPDKFPEALIKSLEGIYEPRVRYLIALASYRDEDLPSEIEKNLTLGEAREKAALLQNAGGEVEIVTTTSVSGVRNRAENVSPDRCSRRQRLTEIDGLITTEAPSSARYWVARMRGDKPEAKQWQQESLLNHYHLSIAFPEEEAVQEGVEYIAQMESALKQAYPNRAFTICHWPGDEVTFWQTTADSPREPREGEELIFIEPAVEDQP